MRCDSSARIFPTAITFHVPYNENKQYMIKGAMCNRFFTKSAFKLALECLWKLYYYRNPSVYANADASDEFLEALSEGGFQVGELAKYYKGVHADNDLKNLKDSKEALDRTNQLMQQENVTIAEAAFNVGNLFVRVDILEKKGNDIKLIEVKAKSWGGTNDHFAQPNTPNKIGPKILPFLYDVAFQKYVVAQALPHCNVKAYLMMADKTKKADIDGLNQLFKIKRDGSGDVSVEMIHDALNVLEKSKVSILTSYDVDAYCDLIIAGKTDEQQGHSNYMNGLHFKEFVNVAAKAYCSNMPYLGDPVLGSKCFECEFHLTQDREKNLKDGKRECWLKYVKPEDYDQRAKIEQLNGTGINRDRWIRNGKYFIDEIDGKDLDDSCLKKGPKLDCNIERKWLQIGMETGNKQILDKFAPFVKGHTYLNKVDLCQEMSLWKYPLHMIDFETTAVALPYYKGMSPYEQVAFQFSHHVIYEDGTIEHYGQYLNEDVNKFPNFEFVRSLRKQLTHDDGTIFRYGIHENTILLKIADQLSRSHEPDRKELIDFIRTITHNGKNDPQNYRGCRDMVDLLEIVKKYFYNLDEMHGSYSIKQVLPAVLNSSTYLQKKYSKPIYGKDIKSCNFTESEPIAWMKIDKNGHVDSPYHQLDSIDTLIGETGEKISKREKVSDSELDFTVANGGAALTAYNKLMFCKELDYTTALRRALLRYCELDTMSMVFIWEYFHHECSSGNCQSTKAIKCCS